MRSLTIFNYLTIILVVFALFLGYSTYIEKKEGKVKKEDIYFSHESGHYNNEFKLKLKTKKKGAKIIFTLDGSIPDIKDKNTFTYNAPIKISEVNIDSNDISFIPTTTQPETPNYETWLPPTVGISKGTPVNSRIIYDNGTMGKVVSKTFFVDDFTPNIPEIFLTIEKNALFDYDTGIYVTGKYAIDGKKYSGNFFQRGKNWERIAYFQYIDKNKNVVLDQKIGIRVHGMASPAAPQKTIKFYARKKYGKSKFKFSPFKNQPEINKYKKLLLRTPYSTWNKRFISDQIVHRIVEDMDIVCAASIPVNLYINGEFWGIHDMAEKIDDRYFKNHFGIPKDNLCYAASIHNTVMGEAFDFKDVWDFAKNNDLSIDSNYKSISNMIDINNYIDFTVIETYLNNKDWPGNNDEKWRTLNPNDKWKWLIIDMDACFINPKYQKLASILDTTKMTKAYEKNKTLIIRKLIENEEFKKLLAARYEELMSSVLCSERLLKIMEEYEAMYENSIDMHIDRWTLPSSKEVYEKKNRDVKFFMQKRTEFMVQEIKEQLGIEIYPNCK